MNPEHSFGRIVRQRRRELDLTQEELARRVGCAAITVRKIEADDARPSVQIAERLAMALAIRLDDRPEFVRLARAAKPESAAAPSPAPAPDEIGREDLTGRTIRGYALAERLGAGAMGAVYRGLQPNVEREVAIKIILPAYANHPDFIRRFEAEAQLVARLEHPHIVPLYDYWREPGVAYLVMRLLRGGSVQTLLQNGPLPLEAISILLGQICSALHVAHRIGVIHRDLKPANVLLDADHNAYLADFGIAANLGTAGPETLNQTDLLVRSPQYVSPEQIRSLSVRPETDIYCLGVMLYEMLTGTLPFAGPTPFDLIQQHMAAPLPPLAARQAGLPATLDAVIGRAAAKDPRDRYPDVLSLLDDFRRALGGSPVRPSVLPAQADEAERQPVNPYKGLRAFDEADAADFFGRETLVQQLLARLGEGGDLARFLAVVGPSGSGKSSVVKAGLIPALRRGGILGSESWFLVDLVPGSHPFQELEAALLRMAANPPENLLAQLRDGDRGLLRAANRILPANPAVELVLVVDQFEEVFTLVQDEAERALLLSSLVSAVLDERSRVRLVVTLRADFTDRPLRYVDFGELLQRRSEFVLPLTPDELERAILGPAQRVGLQLEPGLIAAIVRDVANQPGALPLMQYALTELYERREGHTLTKTGYQAVGGVPGALGRRAEAVYAALEVDGQAAARQLFLRLVTLGEGVEDTRRRVLRSELEALLLAPGRPSAESRPPAAGRRLSAAIDAFGQSHLLSFDRDPMTRGPTVEVAHEALLRGWPRLHAWLDESRADVRWQRLLAAEAVEWTAARYDSSFLLTGSRLEQFRGWAAGTQVALTQPEHAFLEASLAEGERQRREELQREQHELELTRQSEAAQRTAAQRLRYFVGALTLFLLAAIGLSAAALYQQNRAERQARLASSRELAAAAISNMGVDPERSILLALQAVTTTYSVDKTWTSEAEEALHRVMSVPQARLILRHTTAVYSVAFNPQGTRLATTTVDGTATVWDLVTGAQQFSLGDLSSADHGDHGDHADDGSASTAPQIVSVAFGPDGTRLATGSRDGSVQLWDAATAAPLLTLSRTDEVTRAAISKVAFSPDGTRLAAASSNGQVELWQTSTGQRLLALSSQLSIYLSSEPLLFRNDVAFSPDGSRIATEGPDYTIQVWDVDTRQVVQTLRGHTDQILGIDFSPDGTRLVTIAYGGASRVWDAASGQVLFSLVGHGGSSQGAAFSPDGSRVATAESDGTVTVWDALTGQELFSLSGHNGAVRHVIFSPDGTKLATASDDGTSRVWDAAPSREWATLTGHTRILERVAYSPDGKRLATASDDATVRVWDAATGQVRMTLGGLVGPVYRVAYSPDGARLLTAHEDQTAKLWDATTGQLLLTLSGHTDRVWDAAFTPDGTRVVTTSDDKSAKVWDAATGRLLETIIGFPSPAHCLAVSPDGTRLFTGGEEGIIWDLSTGQEVFRLPLPVKFVADVVFSPDGKRLLTTDAAETAEVWDARTGQLLLTLAGHAGGVWGAAWSPDGKLLATGATDNTARIWDAATGQPKLKLYGHIGLVWSLMFSPDSTRLVTASQDKTARVYVLPIEELVALARARVTRSLSVEECRTYLHTAACPPRP